MGLSHLSIFDALLARARPLRVLPSTRAFKNQQMLFSGLHGIKSVFPIIIRVFDHMEKEPEEEP